MPVSSTPLQACLKSGGTLYHTGVDQHELRTAAKHFKIALFEVDCARAKTKSAVLRAIANAVDFPEHFGGNLDALYDCLTDTLLEQKIGMVLALINLHEDDPGLREHAPAIAQVCEDAVEFARENGRIFTFILEKADGTAEPAALHPDA